MFASCDCDFKIVQLKANDSTVDSLLGISFSTHHCVWTFFAILTYKCIYL